MSRSSSGLGPRPFTAVTGVRIPYGMPLILFGIKAIITFCQYKKTQPIDGFFVVSTI